MASRASVLLALLCIFSLGETLTPFVEPGKELIYDYQANINAGSYKPANFESQFVLQGKLHLQNQNDNQNTVLMKFSDLKYKLYNGKINFYDEYESILLPLPKEAENLLKTFQVGYNEDGKVKYFASQLDDLKFSTDLKKAIASIIQIDHKQIKNDAKTPYAFISHEDSIYGNVVAKYNILPDENEMIIQKMIDVQSSKNWISYFGITDDNQYENYKSRQPFSVDAHREYHLVKEDKGYMLRKINAQGGLYTHMMKGFSDSQYMLVNQKMTLLNLEPIKDKLIISDKLVKADLLYKLNIDENDETFTDLSFGRNEFTKKQYESIVLDILREGAKYIKFNYLTPQSPDLKAGQFINRLLRIMAMLDLNSLEILFVSLNKKTDKQEEEMFNLYQEMIPLIGTRSSIVFLCNLIREQKIGDDVAISMLTHMPFHLRMPSKKLLREVEDLINLKNVSSKVHKTAILSFATLVHKVFSSYLMQNGLVKSQDMEDLLEKYILKYLELLKAADDYSQQYLYINGLYNIKIGNVVRYLEPYVKGKATTNRHLRYLAMCASFDVVTKNPQKVYEVYWPIFADSSLHLELRAAAYLIIMASKPSRSKMYDIYSVLKQDPCPELYNIHYVYLKSIVKSQDSSNDNVIANEILNFMRIPYKGATSGSYLSEYTDSKFGFGSINHIMLLSTNTSKAYFIDVSTNNYNYPVADYGIWLKIEGVDTTVLNKQNRRFSTIEQLIYLFTMAETQKNLHVEYAVLQNDKIIELQYSNYTNIDKLISNIKQKLILRPTYALYQLLVQQIMPNDMGLPSVFEYAMPSVFNINFTVTPEEYSDSIHHANYKLQRASHAAHGIAFYNPVCDIWQGINRFQSTESVFALNMKFSLSRYNIKLTFNKQDDDINDKFALRNYATSFTYVYKDVKNDLQKSNKKCEHFVKITHGKQYEKSKIIYEHHFPHSGMQLRIEAFDTHQHISQNTIKKAIDNFVQKYSNNYETTGIVGYMSLIHQNVVKYLIFFSQVGNLGMLIRIIPSKQYPVDHVDLSLELNEAKVEYSELIRHDAKANLATKTKEDETIRRWDINTMFTINKHQRIDNYNIHYSAKDSGLKIFKICMNGQIKHLKTELIVQHNLTLGYTEDPAMCADNEGIIEINGRIKQSDEQKNLSENKKTYDICLPMHMEEPVLENLVIRYEKNLECTIQKTSLRKYSSDIKTTGLSEEFMKNIYNNKFLKGIWFPYYSYKKETNLVEEKSMKVLIDFPINTNEVNIDIMIKNENHRINSMPIPFSFPLENYHFSKEDMCENEMETCLLENQHIFNDNHELLQMIDNEWMIVLYSNLQSSSDHSIVVSVMKMDVNNQYGLRINTDNEDLELRTETDGYKITLNNKPLPVTKESYNQERGFSIGLINDQQNTIIIKFKHFPIYIDYDGNSARIYKPKTYFGIIGSCFTG